MSEPFDHLLEKYARLVVRVGVNVQPGQEVVISALPEQADAARAIAAEAYRVGASRVTHRLRRPATSSAPPSSTRPRSCSARPRSTTLAQVRAWNDSPPALISLTGNPHPTLMEGLDPARLAKSAPIDLIQEVMPLIVDQQGRLDGRRRPDQGLGRQRRRRRRRAAVGRGRRRDAARPGRPGRRLAGARRQAQGARGDPQRPPLRPDPLPRARHRPHPRARRRTRGGWAARSRTTTASSSSPTCPPRRSSSPRTGAAPRATSGPRRRSSSPRWARSSRASRWRSRTARSPAPPPRAARRRCGRSSS